MLSSDGSRVDDESMDVYDRQDADGFSLNVAKTREATKLLGKELGNSLDLAWNNMEIHHAFTAYHDVINVGKEYVEGDNQSVLGKFSCISAAMFMR